MTNIVGVELDRLEDGAGWRCHVDFTVKTQNGHTTSWVRRESRKSSSVWAFVTAFADALLAARDRGKLLGRIW